MAAAGEGAEELDGEAIGSSVDVLGEEAQWPAGWRVVAAQPDRCTRLAWFNSARQTTVPAAGVVLRDGESCLPCRSTRWGGTS